MLSVLLGNEYVRCFFELFFYNCILFGRFNIRHIFGTSGYISVNFLLGYTLGFLRSGIIESA